MRWPVLGMVLGSSLLGCGGVDTFTNAGELRVFSTELAEDQTAFAFLSSASVEAHVAGPLLDACDDVKHAECSVEIEGSDVIVTSVVEIDRGSRLARCKGDRLPAEVACELFTLPDGSHSIHYGNASAVLLIPSTGPELVVGGS